jgi:hypothetical protein
MAKLLDIHGISSFILNKDVTANGKSFKAGKAYIVPLDQPQFRLIESIFEVRTTFQDSIFYDVSAWNMPMAFNLPFNSLDVKLFTADLKGEKFAESQKPAGIINSNGNVYAYAVKWSDYSSPAALYKLLANNIIVKVASSPIETLSGERFERGTLIIPMGTVNANTQLVEKTLQSLTEKYAINVTGLSTGDNRKIDLGSPTLINLEKPRIVVLTEDGVSGFSAGQLWHLFDTRYDMPVTLLPLKQLAGLNLYNYNVLIVPDGNYPNIDEKTIEKIQGWVAAGNTIIGLERASQWLAKAKLMNVEFKNEQIDNKADNYEKSLLWTASREVPGTIYEAEVDLTHPLFYGYENNHIPVYKDNGIIQNIKEQNSLNYPARYTTSPLLSGYSPKGFDKSIAGTPICSVFQLRQGRVIASYNNPVFRGYWRGSNRFLANAIFFGKAIRFSAGGEQ